MEKKKPFRMPSKLEQTGSLWSTFLLRRQSPFERNAQRQSRRRLSSQSVRILKERSSLSYVPLIAPSTTFHRIKFLASIADSFIYVVSKVRPPFPK